MGMFRVSLGAGEVTALTGPAFRAATEVFALSAEAKEALAAGGAASAAAKPGAARGYLAAGTEAGGAAAEAKECFACGATAGAARGAETTGLYAENVWAPVGREGLERYVEAMRRVAGVVAAAVGAAIGDHGLEDVVRRGHAVSVLRVFRYRASGASTAGAVGSAAHTDWGALTVIAAAVDGGRSDRALEVWRGGAWAPVAAAAPDELVVNCGDYVQLRSGGRARSPRHRVRLAGAPRTALVWFQNPAYDAPLPGRGGGAGLSVCADQAEGGGGDAWTGARCYGDVLAGKWASVARGSGGGGGREEWR